MQVRAGDTWGDRLREVGGPRVVTTCRLTYGPAVAPSRWAWRSRMDYN